MGELVKCRDTGKTIPIEDAFTKSSKRSKKKVWFSSESGYKWWNEWNDKCVELLTDIVLEDGMKFPAVARKKLIESGNIKHTYDAIELCVQDLSWAVHHKQFRTEYGMWTYLFMIIDSHYNEAVKIDNAIKDQRKRQDAETIRIDNNYEYFPVKKSKNKAVGDLI